MEKGEWNNLEKLNIDFMVFMDASNIDKESFYSVDFKSKTNLYDAVKIRLKNYKDLSIQMDNSENIIQLNNFQLQMDKLKKSKDVSNYLKNIGFDYLENKIKELEKIIELKKRIKTNALNEYNHYKDRLEKALELLERVNIIK